MVGAIMSILTITSCSKEGSDTPILGGTEVRASKPEAKMRQIQVRLDAAPGEGLRVAYGTHSDGSGKLTGLQLEEGKKLILRVAVRGGGSSNVIIQDIPFTKVPGENRGTYAGAISIPEAVPGSTAGYQIAAALVKQEGGPNNGYIPGDFSSGPVVLDPSSGTHVMNPGGYASKYVEVAADGTTPFIPVPYVSKWQSIGVDTSTNTTHRAVLDLNPQGTLLRMRVRNESENNLDVHSIKMVMTAFTPYINILFAGDSGTDEVYWISNNLPILEYNLAQPITLSPKQTSGWIYTWVMPRATTHELTTSATIGMTANAATRVYSPVAFYTKKALPLGSVPMTLVYGGPHTAGFGEFSDNDLEWGTETVPAIPKLAVEYVSDNVLDASGTGFVNNYDTSNANVGWFNYTDALARWSKPVNIAGQNYSLPTLNEMKSIFPYAFDETGVGVHLFTKGKTTYDLIEKDVKIGNVTKSYKSDFSVNTTGAITYAVRFKDDKNYNKTAFRYRREVMGTFSVQVVESIYLGAESFDKIEEVATETFWTTNSSRIKKATFPLYGTRNMGNGVALPVAGVNNDCYYLLNAPMVDRTSIHFAAVDNGIGVMGRRAYTGMGSAQRVFPIVLFKR